jgi:hypothetical protein
MQMDDGETIAAFGQKLTTLVAEIHSLGEKIDDESVIEVLFSAVPDRFADVVNTIEQWGDLTTMPVSEALGRLEAYENGQRGRPCNGGGKGEEQLMLVTRVLEQLMKSKKSGDGAISYGNSAGKKNLQRQDHTKSGKSGEKQRKRANLTSRRSDVTIVMTRVIFRQTAQNQGERKKISLRRRRMTQHCL